MFEVIRGDEFFHCLPWDGAEPIQCWGYFHSKYKDVMIIENHLSPAMLVFLLISALLISFQ